MTIFTSKLCIGFFVSFLIGCLSSSNYDLWAGDKPKHHTQNGFRNFPLIKPADTQGFQFIWNRMFSSSKSDKIPSDHLIDEKRSIDKLKKLREEDTITWIGQSTALLKTDGKVVLTDPFLRNCFSPGIRPFHPLFLRKLGLKLVDLITRYYLLEHMEIENMDLTIT